MRGVVFLRNRKLEVQEFPDPVAGPGEVVLAMKASGMCGSDFHAYRAADNPAASLGLGGGSGPVIAGHEPCGVVHSVGAGVDPGLVGQRVMNHHYKGCGRCKHCRRSEEHTSELQSQSNLVCRLLLEKKNPVHVVHMRSAVAVDVVEFQKARLWTPVAVFVDKRSASLIALVHRSLHRIRSFVPLRGDRTWSTLAPGFPSDGEALLEHFRDQHIEGL